ncbi:M28 family peptidase [Chamaesiphon minutus]|uniref:Putative aminopeptidase n=1 Tax=Chamaesiphon minutus (strain ATCC 27169 / PCC 6605) TaxID=1173020 RepID=K9UMK6_CHAP6|nr:M28 family peptidase [Chamaesiphon minutus]AFY96060.1 putative aminopeptidase [Chamaesiphon minutus PCC 6605]
MKFQLKLIDSAALKRLTILAIIIVSLLVFGWSLMVWMPGESYRQALPPLSASEIELKDRLQRDVETLATKIGRRNSGNYSNLVAAKDFLSQELATAGYTVKEQKYTVDGKTFSNLEVEIPGSSLAEQILVIGGHYDSAFTSLGANDNGTGAAAVLSLARSFVGTKPLRTIRFVEFTNEEPPFFWTKNMGSVVYAQAAKQRGDKIVGMFSLETLGYFSDKANTQKYPPPLSLLYPTQGNFIGFISNIDSRELLRNTVRSFRAQAKFPSEGVALPSMIQGVGWSDHWSFWQQGYQAVMITDTAPFRYPYYHTMDDSIDKIDFDKLARVTSGISKVISDFIGLQE